MSQRSPTRPRPHPARTLRYRTLAHPWGTAALAVPCHRLVGADGGLRGYAGGLSMKRRLLELECP